MGCDIHIVLERKNPSGGWVGWQQMGYLSSPALRFSYRDYEAKHERPAYVGYTVESRNYGFFNALCGVRGDGSEFGYEERGLPLDASSLADMLLVGADLHSHSWLSIRELIPVLAAHWRPKNKKPEEYVFERMADQNGNVYLAHDMLDENIDADNVDDWRIVFAFDN